MSAMPAMLLEAVVQVERQRILRRRRTTEAMPYPDWLARHFAAYTTAPMAARHTRVWEWFAALRPGVRPRARIEAWPRGGAKSTTIELACAYVGSQPDPGRHFVLYVSETQAQADKHVQAIATMLERVGSARAVNRFGASRGWRRTEVRAANGFNVVAFGLDSGMRGVKLDEFRPDLIVFDDFDGRHDTEATVQKKIDIITETILPAGSADVAVIVVQNLVHEDSIMARLTDGRADFLHDREPPVVERAVNDLTVERTIDANGMPRYVITGGTETWAGQDLDTCERQINDWGWTAFEREAQQEVAGSEDGLWKLARDIAPFRVTKAPSLTRIVVAVDPNAGEGGDQAGIVVAGKSHVYKTGTPYQHGYVLGDFTVSGGPKAWAEQAVVAYHAYQADSLIAEKNNGGEMVAITIGTIENAPPVRLVWASRGKLTRAEPVQKLYEDGRVHHVGTFPGLEREMTRWKPGQPSPNAMDAAVWALTDLLVTGNGAGVTVSSWLPDDDDDDERRAWA
jgi:hypothetical protein